MQTLSAELRTFFELAATTYQSDLATATAAQQYLTGRGFTEEVARRFRLGVVSSPLVGHERYRGRLSIPYLTPAGVVNFRFRCLQDHDCREAGHGKYTGLEGFGVNLYNVLDLKAPGDAICVTEGELDAITLSICGLPAVGVPGASSWKKHFPRCLEDFSRIYVFGDADTAGEGLNKKLISDVRAIPVRLPMGADVNDVFRGGGADAVRSLVRQ